MSRNHVAFFAGSESLRATSPYFDYFTVHEYENIDLPCLASHPSIEVTLMKVQYMNNSIPVSNRGH